MALFKRKNKESSVETIPIETLQENLQEIETKLVEINDRQTFLPQLRHANLIPDGWEHGDYGDIMEGLDVAKQSLEHKREVILERIDKINSGLARQALDHLE